jgi:hypothetical protein
MGGGARGDAITVSKQVPVVRDVLGLVAKRRPGGMQFCGWAFLGAIAA